jgi:2-polyprenyl-6-methoxyphenol hydroxylase-like FAD-dependent oxidoreductase
MTDNYDLIIVGGGPVGLNLGLSLALQDVRVLVIEQASDIHNSPKALM